jgi:hypothetical protein
MNFMKNRRRTRMQTNAQMGLQFNMKRPIAPSTMNTTTYTQKVEPVQSYPVVKQLWGEATWYFFHTMVEKIMEEYFLELRDQLVEMIKNICSYLPCPVCAEHATNYMRNVSFASFQTKEDLKIFLFTFHNDVNKRTGKPLFPLNELDDKYRAANTLRVCNYFLARFRVKSKNLQMLATEMNRDIILRNIQQWIQEHIDKFVP